MRAARPKLSGISNRFADLLAPFPERDRPPKPRDQDANQSGSVWEVVFRGAGPHEPGPVPEEGFFATRQGVPAPFTPREQAQILPVHDSAPESLRAHGRRRLMAPEKAIDLRDMAQLKERLRLSRSHRPRASALATSRSHAEKFWDQIASPRSHRSSLQSECQAQARGREARRQAEEGGVSNRACWLYRQNDLRYTSERNSGSKMSQP
mmetsp:Transcript_68469/g.139245  ORF Transcript_68469/g.139245 Transcript_68469/m.139245 type:complete len:208 (+) Transcript_68469:72-695(+)